MAHLYWLKPAVGRSFANDAACCAYGHVVQGLHGEQRLPNHPNGETHLLVLVLMKTSVVRLAQPVIDVAWLQAHVEQAEVHPHLAHGS